MAHPFGFDELDDALDGGLPAGKLSALVAPPESQSGLLLDRLALDHEALYVSTNRPGAAVVDHLRGVADDPEPVAVEAARPGTLLADAETYLAEIPEGGVVVVDPVDGLEAADREAYLDFLDDLWRTATANDAAVLLHCGKTDPAPNLRPTTLNRADLVMELRFRFHPRGVETYLTITKHRGGTARQEPLKLNLTDEAEVDTSRDIA